MELQASINLHFVEVKNGYFSHHVQSGYRFELEVNKSSIHLVTNTLSINTSIAGKGVIRYFLFIRGKIN